VGSLRVYVSEGLLQMTHTMYLKDFSQRFFVSGWSKLMLEKSKSLD